MEWIYNDGGRAESGYKGSTGDCVTRAIAIATGKPYQEVYEAMWDAIKSHENNLRNKIARLLLRGKRRTMSPRNGVPRKVFHKYLIDLGWKWIPTMQIGQGCKTHLRAEELPKGRLIVKVSKHMVAVIDGVAHDTFMDDRDGTRCVYGYYTKA